MQEEIIGIYRAKANAHGRGQKNIMTKRNSRIFVWLLMIMILAGCTAMIPAERESPPVGSTMPVESESPAPTVEPTPEVPFDPIGEQLSAMSVEQKVGQLLIAGFNGTQVDETARLAIEEYQVGGIILFKQNVENVTQLVALNNQLKALNGDSIPLFLGVDEEGGMVSRMPDELEDLLSPWYNNQIEDVEKRLTLCFRRGQALAAQCAAFGFNLDFAPVMDIWSNPDNTVIGKRAFGCTADEVTDFANMTAYGIMKSGVIPVAKHFPGHGDTLVDSHEGLPVVDKTLEELWENELIPFRQAIESTCVDGSDENAAIPVIMVGHILMTKLDAEFPASLSSAVVTGLLREQLGFEGVICTDDLTMAAISDTYGMGEAAVLALEAGCDLLLVCKEEENLTSARNGLLDAVAQGRITTQRLDESVYRILGLKAQFALSNDPVEEQIDLAALNDIIQQAKP